MDGILGSHWYQNRLRSWAVHREMQFHFNDIREEMRSFGVELLQGTIDKIENHSAPKMQQEVVSYVNKSTSAFPAKLNHYDAHIARFYSGLDDCRDKVGEVLRMSSTLVHFEQFEKVCGAKNSVESRLREPFVTVKAFQQQRERTTLDFGGMQLRLSELQQEVRTLIASPQFGGNPPHDDSRVAHYGSQVSIFCNDLMQCLTIHIRVRPIGCM